MNTVMTPEQWAIGLKSDRASYGGADDQSYIDTLKDLCSNVIEPQVAAKRIAEAYNEEIKAQQFSYWKVWTIYMDAAVSLGGPNNEGVLRQLVQTLIEMSKLPDVIDDQGKAVSEGNRVYWRDIPEFTFYFADGTYENLYRDVDVMSTAKFEAAAHRRFCAHTFNVLYLRALETKGSPRGEIIGSRGIVLRCLADAIEVGGNSAASDRRLELLAPAAATYMLNVADLLYRYSQEEWAREGDQKYDQSWRGGVDDGGKMLWAGNWGYSLDRWHFWKERFQHIGTRLEGVNNDISRQCKQAVLRMEDVERSI